MKDWLLSGGFVHGLSCLGLEGAVAGQADHPDGALMSCKLSACPAPEQDLVTGSILIAQIQNMLLCMLACSAYAPPAHLF